MLDPIDFETDALTGTLTRDALLSMLFRETDRVQRMKSCVSLILLDLDDFAHWNSRLGREACDEMLCRVARRTVRLLRSYDLFGRAGHDEFLTILPGCRMADAVMLAERLRTDVFASPFEIAGDAIRVSACFGIASSEGRSPLVVLREAEQALHQAKQAGPDSIECFSNCSAAQAVPASFLSANAGE
jgi:diguanylate cyclase (GGDEF)-like protein